YTARELDAFSETFSSHLKTVTIGQMQPCRRVRWWVRQLSSVRYFLPPLSRRRPGRRNLVRNFCVGWLLLPSSARITLSATFPPTSEFHTRVETSPPTQASARTRSSGPT